MKVEIRQATLNDRKFISKVCMETIPLYERFLPGFFYSQGQYLEKTLPEGYDFYVIEENGEPTGFTCNKELNNDVVYIAMIYFAPKYYRKGIGTKALALMEENFKQNGYKTMTLLAHKEAFWAKEFYLKNGFISSAYNKYEANKLLDGILDKVYFNGTIVMMKNIA